MCDYHSMIGLLLLNTTLLVATHSNIDYSQPCCVHGGHTHCTHQPDDHPQHDDHTLHDDHTQHVHDEHALQPYSVLLLNQGSALGNPESITVSGAGLS